MKYFELFKTYGWILSIVILIFVLVFSFNNTSKYDAIIEQEQERVGVLQEQNTLLQERVINSNQENAALYNRIDSLESSMSIIRTQTAIVRQEATEEVEESRNYNVEQIASSISVHLDAPVHADFSNVILPQPSARKVLEGIILSEATRKELELTNQRIAKLEEQIAIQNGIIENKDKIIETHVVQIANLELENEATLNSKNAEIAKIKASNRKKNLIFTAMGWIGGVVTGVRIF